jgi:hypothetical protein
MAINITMIALTISTYQIHGIGSAHCSQLCSDGGKVDAAVPQLCRKNLKFHAQYLFFTDATELMKKLITKFWKGASGSRAGDLVFFREPCFVFLNFCIKMTL